jgi:AraC family transcriptional regulator, regulatory protein of adaptative response / methylated-DNA-[protein]-cysteine methyltransferase
VGRGFFPWHPLHVSDYERVASVIRYLDEHHGEQPDLATLARRVGLTPFHFHRLFSKWAGVTPKDFLQCLTASHVRQLLREGASVLSAALDAGLSGPGRLHDLCVQLDAASPGELKSGGAGCEIVYGIAPTPFGDWIAAQNQRGICHLAFIEDPSAAIESLRHDWPRARLIRDNAAAARLTDRVFDAKAGQGSARPLKAFVRGTSFQLRVWRALLRVPSGALVTYGQLAAAVGNADAARAVGGAVGSNSLAVLIPCHRVIRETGVVGEYRWGTVRKRSLIAWESTRKEFAAAVQT